MLLSAVVWAWNGITDVMQIPSHTTTLQTNYKCLLLRLAKSVAVRLCAKLAEMPHNAIDWTEVLKY